MPDGKIKICFLHPWIKDINDVFRVLCIRGLPITERFVLDDDNPDYVVATDFVISEPGYAEKFRKLVRHKELGRAPVTLFYTEECISPDFNMFDYAIAYNWDMHYLDRVSRIPPHIFIGDNMTEQENTLSFDGAKKMLSDNELGFCSFIYSNPDSHPMRDKLFYALSGYRHVVSPGRHLNNVGGTINNDNKYSEIVCGIGRGSKTTWQETSIKIKGRYKFSISAENALSDGYTSEKLLTSFLAHTVPIYWGNPYVAEEYNPEAFVNCHDYDSLDGVVKRVREIDGDDNLWAHMVSQPWQTEKQKRKSALDYEKYCKFITDIFSSPPEKARRRSAGTWTRQYEDWFFDRKLSRQKPPFIVRLFRLMLNPGKRFNVTWWKIKLNELLGREVSIEDLIKEKKI